MCARHTKVEALLAGRPHPIDVCRIRRHDERGAAVTSYFASSANLGLGAGIARRANRYRAFLGDFLGTLAATVVTLLKSRPTAFRLSLDGREATLERALNVTVGKNPFLASGLKLDVDVSPADGRLFVFTLSGIGKLGFLRSLPKVYSGAIARNRRFHLSRATSVTIEPLGRAVEAEFDGDPAGWCPAEVTLLPKAVHLIGPTP